MPAFGGNFLFQPYGSPIATDWVAYTPTFTGFGSVGGVGFFSRRVGANLEVHGVFSSGTSTATQAKITVGFNETSANVTIDTAKHSASTICGIVFTGATGAFPSAVLMPSTNDTTISMGVSSGGTNPLAAANGSAVASSGQSVQIFFSVPIVGWA